ncbi:sigma-70 family RNA polymerase sigma factor [Phycisphaerales bacterium AB-hyl4]|uniref:Sigma-70 family RNA polymerase sigma factor n=1 Tax=Natronomicrosphaera hydrolytica TaxID=3242702 RepID=A0ABV4U3W5_9BACT
MTKLTHPHSPLAQARKHQQVSLSRSQRPLNIRDQATLKRLLTEKFEHVHDELFDLPEAEAMRKVFDEAPPIQKPDTSWYHPVMDNATQVRAGKNVGTVLLSAKEERALFLQFNYCRFRTVQWRDRFIEQDEIDPDEGREALIWFHKSEAFRDQIAQTNLALVLAMAKRTRMSEVDFADLVSEGNMALLRAVDKFDVSRGFKFSTYACRAILKAFSRSGVKLSKYRQMFPTDFDPKLEKSNYMEKKRETHEDECVDELRQIIRSNRADLSDIEQEVIQHRFAIDRDSGKGDEQGQALTLEQVGRIIGVTKERVRQIQNKALEKIRQTLESDFLE